MPASAQSCPISDRAPSSAEPSAQHEEPWFHCGDQESPFFPPEEWDLEGAVTSHGTSMANLQELATTVAKLARDLNIPTVMWVHFP